MRGQFGRVDPNDPLRSWDNAVGPVAGRLMRAAQVAAASGAQQYVSETLAVQGVDPATDGTVDTIRFSGTASDGDDLDALLRLPASTAQFKLDNGAPPAEALDAGRKQLDLITVTQVADAGRVSVGVATAVARHSEGYIRLATPPSCARCIILAGKWYASNVGFRRHPRCDCIHIPAVEDAGRDYTTDPHNYFDQLSESEQDKLFTKAGAQAIRDGADIFQVVNARLSMQSVNMAGRILKATGSGTTRRSVAGKRLSRGGKRKVIRLMPESIYQIAGDNRDELLRLLKLHGYIF